MHIPVLDFLILASSKAAAAIEPRASTCNAANVAFIEQSVNHAVYFCDFYISSSRAQSPFPKLSASDTWNACQCIANSAATPRNYRTVTAPTGATCSPYAALLTNEYSNPQTFCSFYMYQSRSKSTIPGVSVANVQKACSCLTSSASTTISASTSSATKTTTTTKTSTTRVASTITSTCLSTPLPTTLGNFVSGLASWTASASPTAYAAVATGTSYDSSGSSAQLSCTFASGVDTHASICSKTLPVCLGQNYTVSFVYKFSSTSAGGGSLSMYNYGWDDNLATISGPTSAGGSDGLGAKGGSWGSVGTVFEAVQSGDMVCFVLQCLSGHGTVGKKVAVAVDNVKIVRKS